MRFSIENFHLKKNVISRYTWWAPAVVNEFKIFFAYWCLEMSEPWKRSFPSLVFILPVCLFESSCPE